jgi:hypothetical protein
MTPVALNTIRKGITRVARAKELCGRKKYRRSPSIGNKEITLSKRLPRYLAKTMSVLLKGLALSK